MDRRHFETILIFAVYQMEPLVRYKFGSMEVRQVMILHCNSLETGLAPAADFESLLFYF